MLQRMQACPSAWAEVSSWLLAVWQAIITVWFRACMVPTVRSPYDTAGPLPVCRRWSPTLIVRWRRRAAPQKAICRAALPGRSEAASCLGTGSPGDRDLALRAR